VTHVFTSLEIYVLMSSRCSTCAEDRHRHDSDVEQLEPQGSSWTSGLNIGLAALHVLGDYGTSKQQLDGRARAVLGVCCLDVAPAFSAQKTYHISQRSTTVNM
jgi:hypothetical protein